MILNPCPICGQFPHINSRSNSDDKILIEFKIRCCKYKQNGYMDRDIAIEAWNDYAKINN